MIDKNQCMESRNWGSGAAPERRLLLSWHALGTALASVAEPSTSFTCTRSCAKVVVQMGYILERAWRGGEKLWNGKTFLFVLLVAVRNIFTYNVYSSQLVVMEEMQEEEKGEAAESCRRR